MVHQALYSFYYIRFDFNMKIRITRTWELL